MKKILIYVLLLGSINNLNSMEEQPGSSKEFELNIMALPNELRSLFIEHVIKDEIGKWTDIFNFDNQSLKKQIKRICLVSKNFNVLSKEELINCVKRLRETRFNELKQIIKEQYSKFPEEELNKNLANLLNHEISKKTLEEAARLIIAGADVDIQDDYGDTALVLAASECHIPIVKLLIDAKADVNIQDSHGYTALRYATFKGHAEIVRLLIDAKAKINIRDNKGGTALMGASFKGHAEVVKLLIDAGAIQDNGDGFVLLIYAASYGLMLALIIRMAALIWAVD